MICLSLSRPIQSSRFFRVTESAARKYSSSTSYSIRIADFNDIPFIRNCNVVNLPENYDNNFYNQQLKTWPELSLVCQDKDENIVGYALGRVLEANELPRLSTDLITYKGHVASIAVTQAHRGHKLAHKMMDLMHMQFALNYDIDEIDLYCRVSNTLAIRLYQSFNYECKVLVPKYYNDGEDAYRMILPSFRTRYRDATHATLTSRLAPKTTAKQISSYPSKFNSSCITTMTSISLWNDIIFGVK